MKFLHNGQQCQLTRSVEFGPWGDNNYKTNPSVQLIIDGQEQSGQLQDVIEQIIPRQCQQFTFFDGAEITRYAQREHDTGVKEAIELFLGIPAYRNLRDDLAKVMRDLEREQEAIIKAETQSEQLLNEIATLQEQVAQYEERLEREREKKSGLEAALRDLDKEEAQLEAVARERELLDEKQARQADLEARRRQLTSQIDTLIKRAPMSMLIQPLEQIVTDLQIQQEIPTQTEALRRKKRIVESLLSEERCICGREIDTVSRDHLYAETERLSEAIRDLEASATEAGNRATYLSSLQAELRSIKDAQADGHNLLDQRSVIDVQITELEVDIQKLKEALSHHDLLEVRDFYEQRESLERQIFELTHSIDETLLPNLAQLQNKASDKQREADQIAATTDRGSAITQTLTHARALHNTVSTYVDTLVEQERAEIEEIATQILTQITNKPHEYAGVYVDDNYTLSMGLES